MASVFVIAGYAVGVFAMAAWLSRRLDELLALERQA